MPVLYEDDLFRVSQGWLLGWRILFKPTGTQVVPDRDTAIQMGLTWKLVRSRTYRAMAPPGRMAENFLFEAFAHTAFDPSSSAARDFNAMSPEDLAFAMVSQANIEDTASRLSARNSKNE